MTNAKTVKIGRILLFVAAFLWGTSFAILKNVLENIPPLYILAFRFCCAALILLPACIGKLRKIDVKYLAGGALMGIALLLGYVLQTYGLQQTTPGKNAFLTSVYCIIVPFLYWVIIRKRPDKYNAAAAAVCIIGIGLISLDNDLNIGVGDALTLASGFFFALHIVVSAKAVSGRDPVILAMLQFASAGVIALIGAVIFVAPPLVITASDVWSVIFLTVVCTAGCLLMQVFGQKYTPPSQAAVILTLEAVFGALISVMFFREVLTVKLTAGFIMTFAAVIISETKLEFLRKKA
jgi:drug/metabolite transporter (DMT)-like permease